MTYEHGRKISHVHREAPVREIPIDTLAYAVAIVRTHWGDRYRMAHYPEPSLSMSHGYTLFQVAALDGARFLLAVNHMTGDWWHGDLTLDDIEQEAAAHV
jgi:hypothetical protein